MQAEQEFASGPVAVANPPHDYRSVLTAFGLDSVERGVWAVVGRSGVQQGWKLHLSSIPLEAPVLLETVIPVLVAAGVSFKVARNEEVLARLNEGELGATQIGKFITIYPASVQAARELAEQLIDVTGSFDGPVVSTDLRLGRVVYARYGAFDPIVRRDRLGQIFLCLTRPDGSLAVDAYTVPFVPPEGIENPFSGMEFASPAHDGANGHDHLLGPGYLVLDVLAQHAKGSVYRGIDLRSQEQVAARVIKQGRRHCLSDQAGRDMRSRLRRQAELHHILAGSGVTPQADAYFEVHGDGFLPIDYVEGQSIESLAVRVHELRAWRALPKDGRVALLEWFVKVLDKVGRLHAAGYVHRDLTASNLWIGADGEVTLLDLELCYRIAGDDLPFGLGTPGFMSPQQASRQAPAFADDVYALGCVLVLLLSAMDPRRVLFPGTPHREQYLGWVLGVSPAMARLIDRCLADDPARRPDPGTIAAIVGEELAHLRSGDGEDVAVTTPPVADPEQVIMRGVRGLLEDRLVDPDRGLWLSLAIRSASHQTGEGMQSHDLRRSTNRGVAGVVYFLSRYARSGADPGEVAEIVQRACSWLLDAEPAVDAGLPGLHFGEAGVAVALSEAVGSGLIERDRRFDAFLASSLAGPVDWPDITHGAAGQGIAAMYCADLLRQPELADAVLPFSSYLIETQLPDGSWRMPAGVDGMSGQVLTGFAHGVAGMVCFLAMHGYRSGDQPAIDASRRGASWLMQQAIASADGKSLQWRYSDANPDTWQWWCHGAPGIALAFLQLYRCTGEAQYGETAARALRGHPVDIRYGNLSQCHGLSGLGEIYLEAADVLRSEEWTERAAYIAATLVALGRETGTGTMQWLVEDAAQPTSDLMVGSAGVLHFLMRFAMGTQRAGFPLLRTGLA